MSPSIYEVIAVLFTAGGVEVAYADDARTVRRESFPNTVEGAAAIRSKTIDPFVTKSRRPLVCLGAAEGMSLRGPVFERLASANEFRGFMYAQPKYLIEAKAWGLSSSEPGTLLRACEELFPDKRRVG